MTEHAALLRFFIAIASVAIPTVLLALLNPTRGKK